MDPLFSERLDKGHSGEYVIVEWMRDQGGSVAHGVKLWIVNHDKTKHHLTIPDSVPLLGIPVVMEMKGRDLSFTDRYDFPFSTVYLEPEIKSTHKSKTWAWIIYSELTHAACCVFHTDRDDSWGYGPTTDRERQSSYRVLQAPKRFLRPISDLMEYILPRSELKYIDGNTSAFESGGGRVAQASIWTPEEN